ncbi:UDP-N-acetylglucosamine 2-epimerase (non-hydrolyzing) [Candidatus Pacebacteria bacterium]|nr:UDP-N-acetylglucosamine 2-epimerase (non-hydrolyzing) [Candidatus Paceibacterota bacterium]
MKICFIFGTRPEIIKLAPVIHEAQDLGMDITLIHTGQHYSKNMDEVFIEQLSLSGIDYNLQIGSGSHGAQTAKMITALEPILIDLQPDWVIVQGDTNSVLAGALTASKLGPKIAHVEAGLRSYDQRMPEEINRVVTGTLATMHFVPTKEAKDNLLKEGIPAENIKIVGNTIVDSVLQNRALSAEHSNIMARLSLSSQSYQLLTIHRPENTDREESLSTIVTAMQSVAATERVVWPVHPRTKKQLELFGLWESLTQNENFKLIEPVDFFDMLELQQNASCIVTDSGGIQEESCILQVPCVTVRNNTERPESVAVGANELVTCDVNKIIDAIVRSKQKARTWDNPFGDGTASQQIMTVLKEYVIKPT